MSRLLYITLGLSGGLNASLELARRVSEQGHTVSFLGHRDVADRVEAHGYKYVRVDEDDQAMAELRNRMAEVGPLRSLPLARKLRNQVVQSREIESAVLELNPDALIIDVEAHYAIIATRSLGIPTLTKSDFFSMRHQRGVPPLHSPQTMPTQAMPAKYWQHLRAEWEWVRARIQRIVSKTAGELHPRRLARRWAPFRYNTISRRDLKTVASVRGLDLNEISSQSGWLWPQTYPEIPLISSTPRELDFVKTTSPNDRWVGPLVLRSRFEANVTPRETQQWRTFRDHNAASGRPLIYCSFGTILPNTSAMLAVVLEVARGADWDLVVGLGGRVDQREPGPSSADHTDGNVLVLDFAPQLEVLEAADLAIIHGGINGILESLTFDVPMIVEQSGPVDGPGNARRVDHFGIGHCVDIAGMGAPELGSLIDTTLSDPTMRLRVSQIRDQLDSYRIDQVLEDSIALLLNPSPE